MKTRKTKAGPSMDGLIIPAGALLLAGFGWVLAGYKGFSLVLLLVFAAHSLLSLYFFVRTINISYLVAAIFQFMIAIYLATIPKGIFPYYDARVAWFFYLCGLTFLVWLWYLVITKKARWKGREIFELAAAHVEVSTHGYTERPRPVGTTECSRSQLLGLADYLKRQLVAISYWDNSTVYFVPVRMGEEYRTLLGLSGHYYQRSWVSIDSDGNVSVKIMKNDYYLYKDELDFDSLCEGMGNLFMEFLDDYKKGNEPRILNKLDSVGMNYFS